MSAMVISTSANVWGGKCPAVVPSRPSPIVDYANVAVISI